MLWFAEEENMTLTATIQKMFHTRMIMTNAYIAS